MIIPIGNTGNLRRAPFITIILILINIMVFWVISGKVGRHNERIADAYYEYTDAVLNYLIYEEGYSFSELMSNPDYFLERVDNHDFDTLSIYYESAQKAYTAYQSALNGHIFHELGVSRKHNSILNFFSSMFTHADFFHLLGNLWFLLLLGANVEDTYGRFNYLIFFLLSGIVSSLIFILSSEGNAPLIGASGAIAGIMGVFMIRHFRTKIKFFYFFAPFRPLMGTFKIMAGIVLPLWFLQQIFYAMGDNGSEVAFIAHIGGFIFGVFAALIINYFRIEERFIAPRIEEATNLMGYTLNEQTGVDLYYKKSYRESAALLENEFLINYNKDSFIPLFHSMINSGMQSKAAAIAELYIRKLSQSKQDMRIAVELFREIEGMELTTHLGAGTLLMIAGILHTTGHFDESRVLYRRIIDENICTIIGAKTLLYVLKNDIHIGSEDDYIEQFMQCDDEDVLIIANQINKENI